MARACRAFSCSSWPSSNLQPEHPTPLSPLAGRRQGGRPRIHSRPESLRCPLPPRRACCLALWPPAPWLVTSCPGRRWWRAAWRAACTPPPRACWCGENCCAGQLQWPLAMRGRCMSPSVICAWARSCCACLTPPHCHIEAWICVVLCLPCYDGRLPLMPIVMRGPS
jgi:hypothetical protein